MKRLTVGVAGGTGSGKTTVVKRILENLPADSAVVIPQDAYYREGSHLALEERRLMNYDHPESFDNELLLSHLRSLREGRAVRQPIYSFEEYRRTDQVSIVEPRPIIIIEGILIFRDERIRELLDLKIFVEADADERFIRRLMRDLNERGRNVENVVRQYRESVKPMHLQYVEPTKRHADLIIPGGGENVTAIGVLVARLRSVLTD
jgi:uridine kinase